MPDKNWESVLDSLMEIDGTSLSDWEAEFVESLGKQRAKFKSMAGDGSSWVPSDKQQNVMEKIDLKHAKGPW
mgnify:CR=1 FL=1